ncbi:hypothetical protein F4678DRAFT_462202 [Xylaria arbuscula]|nr:hypothetical protein F4678DRAFT_462202 [Xylaria arbuscula]
MHRLIGETLVASGWLAIIGGGGMLGRPSFDDSYRLVVIDLGSRPPFQAHPIPWIIGGDESLKARGPIRIRVTQYLQFRAVISAYDTSSDALRAEIDAFRQVRTSVEDDLDSLLLRSATELPTGTYTPTDEPVLKKKLGTGGFSIVHLVWNASTGEEFALKEPNEEFEPDDEEAWKHEAMLMSRVSHGHIVKFLGYEAEPRPSLRFEYLPCGTLWGHLRNHWDGQWWTGTPTPLCVVAPLQVARAPSAVLVLCMLFASSIAPALTQQQQRNSSTPRDITKYARMAPERTVQQMLALSKDALIEFMRETRDARGRIDISSITDWELATKTDRRELGKKLAALGPLAIPSLDITKLMEKLSGIPAREEISSEEAAVASSSPQTGRSSSLSPQPGADKEHQIRCRQWLIDEGGKPLCSLEILDKIYDNPEAYATLLEPWLDGAPTSSLYDAGLFSQQLEAWREFRRWQRSNRGLSIVREEDFDVFLNEQRHDMESKGFSEAWQRDRSRHEQQWKRQREVPNGTFTEYTEAARLRVAGHGFARQFELREDVEEQDDRTTWIEYLEFECWTLDQLMTSAQPKQGTKGPLESERSRKLKSSHQLRVQWVLSKMPAGPEAGRPAVAAQGKRARPPRTTQKRKRTDETELTIENTDAATDEVVKRPIKKRKMPRRRAETAHGKETSRMLVGLMTPLDETRVQGKTRRSARIHKALEAKRTLEPKNRRKPRASGR